MEEMTSLRLHLIEYQLLQQIPCQETTLSCLLDIWILLISSRKIQSQWDLKTIKLFKQEFYKKKEFNLILMFLIFNLSCLLFKKWCCSYKGRGNQFQASIKTIRGLEFISMYDFFSQKRYWMLTHLRLHSSTKWSSRTQT